ncbi:hypothetical protein GCM10017786_41330 [Amycolatopsis deserti]|uniref:Uncharacterized protein n=1 Tax=Amycolatopsis deserti TaxID=185696 RepID=A0ABQ3J3T6_9PSEU|nr:hypothetical protein GCM10017786_41330 [Amycolatopsis deserti]
MTTNGVVRSEIRCRRGKSIAWAVTELWVPREEFRAGSRSYSGAHPVFPPAVQSNPPGLNPRRPPPLPPGGGRPFLRARARILPQRTDDSARPSRSGRELST